MTCELPWHTFQTRPLVETYILVDEVLTSSRNLIASPVRVSKLDERDATQPIFVDSSLLYTPVYKSLVSGILCFNPEAQNIHRGQKHAGTRHARWPSRHQ